MYALISQSPKIHDRLLQLYIGIISPHLQRNAQKEWRGVMSSILYIVYIDAIGLLFKY